MYKILKIKRVNERTGSEVELVPETIFTKNELVKSGLSKVFLRELKMNREMKL
jgi:hypothetical protein